MIEPDAVQRELDAARRTYPDGDRVTGQVTLVPHPGRIGLLVDLGEPPQGFVDALYLPESPDRWPSVGTVTDFEVLQHRLRQIRLWPLDPAFRASKPPPFRKTDAEWRSIKHRHPVGSEVVAEIIAVYPANREYVVTFDGVAAGLAWPSPPPEEQPEALPGTPSKAPSDAAPVVGTRGRFVVDRLLDTTRRVLLRAL